MSLSRARSRAVALVAALPLFVVAGPVVSAANAEDGPLAKAVMVETLGANRVGPNAGYRGDVARGVNGTTAIMQLDLAPAAVIETVKVKIDLGKAFSVYQNFSSIDGVAVYKDSNANGRLDAAEHAAGAVTKPGYSVSGDGTAAVVTLTGDPAKATGASDYLVTVHPAAAPVADRNATFTIPANGIQTSTGAVPSAAFALPNIVIDSLAPALIPAANFTPVNRYPLDFCPPGSAPGFCGDDGYLVYRGATPAEDGAKIAFFNTPGDVSDAALLVAKPAEGENAAVPALYDLSSVPSASTNKLELSIGNGTGRDASVPGSKALNNQLSDDVVVAQWDLMGNVASQTFTNNNPCPETQTNPPCASAPLMGNDVTGVKVPTWTLGTGGNAFNNINANTANPAAVPVHSNVTGEDSARPTNRKQTTIGQIRQVAVLHRLAGDDATSLYAGPQGWGAAFTPTTTAQATSSTVNAASNENYPSPSRIRATLRLVDQAGNSSTPLNTALRWRDLVKPKFAALSLLDLDADNKPSEGDEYRVIFDEPMEKTDVTNTNVHTSLNPDNVEGSGTCTSTTPTSQPCPGWGNGATVTWSTDGRMVTIKLGADDDTCAGTTENEGTCRLAEAGDEVHPGGAVSDPAGNTLANAPFIIQTPTVLMHQAVTKDTAALAKPEVFSTGRDGVLDTIDVTFTGPVDKDSITAASDANKFTVSVPGGSTLTASAVGLGGGSTTSTVRLSFTVPAEEFHLYGTSATPVVSLTDGNILTAGTQIIDKFNRAAEDGAGPVPVAITTQDSNLDGKIDKVLVKHSEPVKTDTLNPCGYTVTGYGDSAYKPAGSNAAASSCPTTGTTYRNAFAAVAGQPDTIALTLKVGTANDTNATPAVNFNSTNKVPAYAPGTGPNGTSAPECNPNASLIAESTPDCPVVDTSERANGLPFYSGTAADAAAPVIVGRATSDADSDGHLDGINITYSEPVSSPSLAFAQFQVSEPAYTVKSLDQTSDNVIRIALQPSTDPAGDTAVRPKVAALGGTSDLTEAQNATPADAAGVQVTDKAGPAIMAACVAVTFPADTPPAEKTARLGKCPEGPGDKVAVLFSEALDTTAGVVAATDFVVEQPAGTAKTVGSVTVSGAVATLTMAANNTLDGTKDAFVRLATAGAVNDNAAAPKNASTQTATIGAWAPPSVTLNLTCPTPANPGYCVDNRIDTGAAGTSGVVKWRLATTPRGTTTADSDFKETIPSKYPEAGTTLTEGTHTLYLSGKDGLDRITPEVSDSITVLYSPAIRNFQFVNSETPRLPNSYADSSTVRDGDSLKIGADAYGTDAADWAANSAPIGGGCLAQHMSIDVRSLTGKSTDGAKAPLECNLVTGTETPYRQMQFGVVKVAGTTKYPVGTVVKVTDSEPGSMIVDGPNGTQVRRPFISVNARRSWMSTDASVIKVSLSMLSALPKGKNLGYRNGALLRSSTGYYYVENGVKRPVSTTQLSAWRMSTSTAYAPTSTELKGMPTGSRISGAAHPAGTFIKYSTGTIYQVVKNAQGKVVRRKVASTSALRTLVPTSQIYPALSSDSKLAVDTWLRGYRDGTVLKFSDGSYGVIARGSLRKFAAPAVFNTLGYATSNALAANGNAMPRVNGQAYRVGATIDRYKITTAAIKVTNKAGTSVTQVVIPSLSGIYGVGTLDAVPAGWDTTR